MQVANLSILLGRSNVCVCGGGGGLYSLLQSGDALSLRDNHWTRPNLQKVNFVVLFPVLAVSCSPSDTGTLAEIYLCVNI